MLALLLFGAFPALAHQSPPGCSGSGLGIDLFGGLQDVHVGDTLRYSVRVFNSPFPACDASGIQAGVVTPDGVTNMITQLLVRNALAPGESDFYPDVVSYVVRAQDIRPDGTVRATAFDNGDIHQNDTNSRGGGNQGINTEVNLPCILVTAVCVGGVGQNGAITFSGTVTNCGNNTLVGVTVTNFVNNVAIPVLFPTNLAIGQVATFSGSWVPLDACSPSVATLTVRGTDEFTRTPRTVTNFTTITCQNTLNPGIKVTKNCPSTAVAPGGLLTFTGTVKNTGDVALSNVLVVNDQPSPNTTVFTVASLAPGEVANFFGSYTAPVDCSVSDTLIASARSACGRIAVSDTVTAICPIVTTPAILVTATCPTTPILPGGSVLYTGTVKNTGNIPLKDVVVLSDHPAANTSVFTVATLAPGATATFTAVSVVPAAACAVTTTFTGSGKDVCSLNTVAGSVTTTCGIVTAPAISVTLACPTVPATVGGLITYSGTVSNSGDVRLDNVFVVNNQPAPNSAVIGPITLAPGATVNFNTTFTAPADACSVGAIVTATGKDSCSLALVSKTASAACDLATTPIIVVTQACPTVPATPGGLLTYTGTVKNGGNVTLTNVVVMNDRSGATPVFTAATLAPGAIANFTGSFLAPTDCSVTSVATATARSICGVAVTGTVTSTCPIQTAPSIVVTAICPTAAVTPGGSILYSGTVRNTGNITLKDVVVLSDRPAANTSVFTVATLAPGATATFTAVATAPPNACTVTTTFTGSGKDICSLVAVTSVAAPSCTVLTTPEVAITLSCPTTPATAGGLITYSGRISNPGNVALFNVFIVNNQPAPNTAVLGPIALSPGAAVDFTTTFTAPVDACSVSATVTVKATDACTAAPISKSVSATCDLVTTPLIVVTQACPVTPATPGGLVTYTGTVKNGGNVTLTNVIVMNNMSGATPVFTAATLAPGAIANFTGSFLANTDCSVTSVATATARSICGVAVTGSVTSTCPIVTAPSIVVTAVCPTAPVTPGGSILYSGTVRNTGNITLKDVVVLSDHPAANTSVFTVATLAPGATATFTAVSIVPPNACTVTTTFTGSGKDICSLVAVTSVVPTTCTVVTAPDIMVTLSCPTTPATAGGLITYTGRVSNPGNVALFNVFIRNNQPAPGTAVIGPIALAPGAAVDFATTFTAPADSCSVSATVTATATDACTAAPVSKTASATCDLITTPAIVVTQACPTVPATPGSILTYTGTVKNGGNVTLTNVVVLNNMSGATPVFTAATLAPGAIVSFTGSYLTPTNCSVTSVSTATGRSVCGVAVTSSVTSTCEILTAPSLLVTQNCPATSVLPGDTLTYTGTVKNTGNITLTNIVVLNNKPATNTVVFTLASLAPGASANFTGSYQVPTNCCVVSSTLHASAQGCAGVTVTDSATRTCIVLTLPKLVVTKICPPGPLHTGDTLAYSGSVSNAGNITLINVTVVNDQSPAGPPVFGPVTMAPGESFTYAASYVIPGDFCGTDTVTAKGLDVCTYLPVVNSVTTTCPVITAPPSITVTKNCPLTPTPRGGLYTYTGTVGNPGPVTLINVYVVDSEPTNNTPVIGPITLAPGAVVTFTNSYVAPHCCCLIFDTLTARGQDRCTGSNVTATASSVCPLLTDPQIELVQVSQSSPITIGGVYSYSGYVTNKGDVVLTNVFVFGPQGGRAPILGPIELAPGESENYSGSYLVPADACSVSVTVKGQDVCAGLPVSKSVTSLVVTAPSIGVTQSCPAAPVPVGGRVVFDGVVMNNGNLTLTNVLVFSTQPNRAVAVLGPITLAPGASAPFSGSYISANGALAPTNTVIATGVDICQARTVAAASGCHGPVAVPLRPPTIVAQTLANGTFSLSIPTEAGKSYVVQFKNSLNDAVWTDLQTVTGTGASLSITDPAAAQHAARFYRIMSQP